ncbi:MULTISPECIES: Lrp/AsnC family transcriptional regulator [Halorussus]|uniref:Lrp/AsnC family transcriptional regulator n=1 Tax=Halorussus TaxID=1070314 RepID=UPI0020A08D47|nr:Lrp/AsnC family transcriptional regulator [Halorussus vallis]USZ77617.1 Lrp/AsnC family transcriptional regulator [Halorussus vallis]
MTDMTLDDIDVKILKILQADGRTALSEIARRLDMGSATIHERVNSLEAEGYIRDYRAVLDPELLGLDDVAFIRIHTEAGHFSEVAERLAEESAIQEIHELTGEADLLLKVRVGDRSDLTDLLSRIGTYEGVISTATDVALRSVKEEQRLNLPE